MRTIVSSYLGLLAATAVASPLERRQSTTAVVNFGNNTGTPQHLASGTLYGLPDVVSQIPDNFFSDIGWNYERAGGAQTSGKGWIAGLAAYKTRFASTLANYKTTIAHGGTFILLIHDLWGADGTQGSSAPYPGDNGDWSSWDNYLTQLIADINANAMTTRLVVDIWNEPDLSAFWGRTQDQYLQMWGRTYYKLRAQYGTNVLLSGPASAGEPLTSNSWWQKWASFAASNRSIPDQYAWHMEGGGGDLISAYGGLVATQKQYGLPSKPININEYAVFNEQVPSGSAWWIAQLERINAHGLRGNWLSGSNLHDYLASLLGKTGSTSGYYPNGDYQVYKYYYQNMTGHRVGTTPSADLKLDAYATVGSSSAIVLVGVRISTGTWTLQLNDLSALGLPTSGTLNVQTWGFPVASDVHYGRVDGPTNLGVYGHAYSGNTVSFPVYQTDATTAYAFQFSI
ncbi:glycoside hydrolase superfamily [Diaporthe sp. PMI_573]|nr:glycoside hydrolase superfamily [Diaporthaceae sp. PMI_573]